MFKTLVVLAVGHLRPRDSVPESER
jgi:hypothetical protein